MTLLSETVALVLACAAFALLVAWACVASGVVGTVRSRAVWLVSLLRRSPVEGALVLVAVSVAVLYGGGKQEVSAIEGTVLATQNEVTIEWEFSDDDLDVDGETAKIQRRRVGTATWETIGTEDADLGLFVWTGFSVGESYEYRVVVTVGEE